MTSYQCDNGSDGDVAGEAAFDVGDGLTSNIGLLFGDVECCDIGCGLSGIFSFRYFFSFGQIV